ncbi:MAG: TerB N-terminal domain-containing protein [Planctomycetaceae bacterium]|nr:TerB N-terminal domain-containing protein [Planctomycetaceae bacterium]
MDDGLAGRRVRCPSCRTVFTVSDLEPSEETAESFPDWLVAFCAGAILIMIGFGLSLRFGAGRAALLVSMMTIVLAAVWKRETLRRWIVADLEARRRRLHADAAAEQARHHQDPRPRPASTNPAAETKSTTSTNLVKANLRPASHVGAVESSSELVEIRAATKAVSPHPTERPPKSTVDRVIGWMRGPVADDIRFFGPGTVLQLETRLLEAPLVYHVEGKLQSTHDASLIETELPVAPSNRGFVERLPYWPSFRSASPAQRRRYLDWLTTGRCQTDIEIGYVFIYFYGLERRVLVDRRDHEAVLGEVLRLLSIYGTNNSFRRYASSFLWTTILCLTDSVVLPDGLMREVIASTAWWNDDSLNALLAGYLQHNFPIPAAIAFIAAGHDPRTPRSVVVRRHPERFEELFAHRYTERFGTGITLRAAKNPRVHAYVPASATLGYQYSGGPTSRLTVPNVLGLSSQFKPLVELWSAAVNDLKAYNRAHQKSNTESMTGAMWEALPPELRIGDHPDLGDWYELIGRHTSESGHAFVPVGEFAAQRGIAQRTRLTKKQCEDLLKTADSMGLALEPDARSTGQTYRWEDAVSVFPLIGSSADDKSYHAASLLLRLGMTVASADGTVNETELSVVTAQLEQRFHLTPQESTRLENLAMLLARFPVDDVRLAKKMGHLPGAQRELIGEFIVSVATADEVVTPEELKALRKVYRNLGLNADNLQQLAAGRIALDDGSDFRAKTAIEASDDELVLDPERIRRIMSETEQVADLLQTVMLTEEDDLESTDSMLTETADRGDSTSIHSTAGGHLTDGDDVSTRSEGVNRIPPPETAATEGLDPRYHRFLHTALSRAEWTWPELEALAREQRLMVRGAIEAINEWSTEKWGDLLLDDTGNSVIVQQTLATSI